MTLTPNMRGAIFMVLSMIGFSVNDALIKVILQDLPLFQAVVVRGVVATGLIAIYCVFSGAFKDLVLGKDLFFSFFRAFSEMGGTVCFLTAVTFMPLANATAVLQFAPLAIAVSGWLFFGEKLGWRRITATIIGFVGVLIVIRPTSNGFDTASLWALGTVLFIVARETFTKKVGLGMKSELVTLITLFTITALSFMISLFQTWEPVEASHMKTAAIAGVFLVAGNFFGVISVRSGEISFVAPFRYTIMIWATLLGYILFSELPDFWTVTGTVIIVCSGIFMIMRERKRGVVHKRRWRRSVS